MGLLLPPLIAARLNRGHGLGEPPLLVTSLWWECGRRYDELLLYAVLLWTKCDALGHIDQAPYTMTSQQQARVDLLCYGVP